MSDGPAFLLISLLACAILGTCGYVAGNTDELERGLDVPERVELD